MGRLRIEKKGRGARVECPICASKIKLQSDRLVRKGTVLECKSCGQKLVVLSKKGNWRLVYD